MMRISIESRPHLPWLLINFLMKVILANSPRSNLLNLQIYFFTNTTLVQSLIWSRNILNLLWFNTKIFKSRWHVYEDRLLSDLRIVRTPDWFHSRQASQQACWDSLERTDPLVCWIFLFSCCYSWLWCIISNWKYKQFFLTWIHSDLIWSSGRAKYFWIQQAAESWELRGCVVTALSWNSFIFMMKTFSQQLFLSNSFMIKRGFYLTS